jgi:hypothetical protein
MNNHLKIDSLWKIVSANVLDMALRSDTVRHWIVKKGQEQLYRTYVIENSANLPTKVQDIRCQALINLLHTLDRAFGDGNGQSPPPLSDSRSLSLRPQIDKKGECKTAG